MVGDELTIGGYCRDGRIDASAPEDELMLWRVKAIEGDEVVLQPLREDGSVDAFNDFAGEFRIVPRVH